MSLCSGQEIKFVVDLDHTVIHTAREEEMSESDRSGMAALLDAERSLLPEQRTLHGLEMAGDKYWLKLRPVAMEFLEKLAEVGQITVFTLGIGYALPHQSTSNSNCGNSWWATCLFTVTSQADSTPEMLQNCLVWVSKQWCVEISHSCSTTRRLI